MEGKLAPRAKSSHLMCRTPFWGIAGAVVCAYLCYVSYSRLEESDFSWSHDWQSIATAAVWTVLVLGLLSETRCWREWTFFGLLLVNFASWLVASVWTTVPATAIRDLRKLSIAFWGLAALMSLATIFAPRVSQGGEHAVHEDAERAEHERE